MSPLKLAVFAALFVPALWLAVQAAQGWLGSKPLTEAIHQSGDWAVRFLMLSLLVTPLRSIARWPGLIAVRRMMGLAALAYVLLHLALHIWLEAFDLPKIAAEIALRFYLTIGFIALLGLAALGATSTDGMIRRMGAPGWNRLHAIVYWLSALALLHFALQRKIAVYEPMLMTGFFLWLMGYRLLIRARLSPAWPLLLALAAAAGLLTAFAEYLWYATMTGVPAARVLAANLDFSFEIRPAWWVLAAGLAMAALAAAKGAPASRGGRANALAPGGAHAP